jgi:transposase-like protein
MNNNSLIQVATTFTDKQFCLDYLAKMRWPDGVVKCPHCTYPKAYVLKNKSYKCAECRKPFSATKGTIFENSAIPLQKWFVAIYLHSSHKKGISSCQLAKDITVTQKTAWFMLGRIRHMLESGKFEHADNAILEIDETFVGGKEKNKHKQGTRDEDKMIRRQVKANTKIVVGGILERGGQVTAKVLPNTQSKTLIPYIKENVKPYSDIMSDEHVGYSALGDEGFLHQTVAHQKYEFVRGAVHTNGIENFWSGFKRGIIGVYHHCSPKHLDKYVDEFEFRFNTRKLNEGQRFEKALSLSSRRLTYVALIADNGKDANPFFKFRPEL